ncbi:hypothetical protein Lqui_2401 [Legionella quinlivanii]|uniref:Uncharacterized protein n=1 Tax=Legionella quinlivanii TaxID=45073 RepID=A0A0W0XTA4_9GAMM|nr:hypothetical protein [Legionella quinlivanii]KTD47475.1 hypothetical protein Lqui_2401 [Legionella quinlivanii]MCW8451840.1 hypothetical protein [Legionella quinlivanii]SEG39390.1 hypothetical protein SAMN02746093_02783 [Legionella quinlivanii DSM 21216]STY09964.1 Uncharacterised protein [Legionella quinlivanii]
MSYKTKHEKLNKVSDSELENLSGGYAPIGPGQIEKAMAQNAPHIGSSPGVSVKDNNGKKDKKKKHK